mmetsp:Transcript_65067/g.136309  ORF Transcript_65067/g.136309 Transcript_65067/m.136309 type:complete len:257 (+) Transcript_65067:271-1041(+)
MPWGRAELLVPGKVTGDCLRLRLSPIAEHLWSAGAPPAAPWRTQLARRPCRWQMLFSCVAFAVPAAVHLVKREHLADWLAGLALLVVSITSPLCDAFFVDSTVIEGSGPNLDLDDDEAYRRTADLVGISCQDVVRLIQDHGASPEILCNDRYNNLTRLIDRYTCVFCVLPALTYYCIRQRPAFLTNLPFAGGVLVAWATCLVDQRYRYADPCGIRYLDGRWVTEKSYLIHQRLHEIWHYLLVLTFTCSALYRPGRE